MYPTIVETHESRLDRVSSYFPAAKIQSVIALALVANMAIAPAAAPAIGVAVARGAFELDASRVAGNGTLFEGSIVETRNAVSELKLNTGVHMLLDAGSRTRVYRDHMLLEKGTGQVVGAAYRIQARSLEIEGASAQAAARVSMTAGNRVLVAAVNGPVRVRNSHGLVVASLSAGRAVEMEAAGDSSFSTVNGVIHKSGGRYLLTDEVAGVTFEVRSCDLDAFIGQKVAVAGRTEAGRNGAPAVLFASKVNGSDVDNCREGAGVISGAGTGKAKGAAGAAGKAAGKAGVSAGAKAVIAGVVVAGAATGTAVALTREESKTSISN
ncbi:MAG: hypothetical protein SFV51_28045 [Bryobacteraceae bacterium]|nr:hypothetical protein [Bryobacteraceae bacterium]